ncbi:retrovirus-related pol polyprotein from transposon TNT 1-94 [Tanacetum coccineum]
MEVLLDEEEVALDAIPLTVKSPSIIDWKIHKEGKKSYYQIIRADGSSKMYLVFSHMLKIFDREDLETLYKLVKAKYGSTRLVEDSNLVLYGDLKTMFEPHVEDNKQNVHIHMLVEKRYLLTHAKITDMLNKKLQCDHFSEMLSMKKLKILKDNIKFKGGLLGLKDFMMILKLLLLRTKQPIVVPISTREPKRTMNQSVATSLKKTFSTESTVKKPRSIIRKLYDHVTCRDNSIHRRLWVLKAHDQKSQAFKEISLSKACSRGIDLYSITFQDLSTPNLICLMAKATSFQAWLWHRRLSHLNFDSINLLSKNDIVIRLPKLKFVKDHICSSCELGKAKQKSFHKKTTLSCKRRLQLLHMDLCGPMRVESINEKKYVLVIIDDYSRYTWTHFLSSKDETPEVLIDFLRLVQRGLHAQKHETSTAQTPEQNGIVERHNRTLVEAARTMLSATKVPLFFWAEAIATSWYSTQSRAYRVYNKRTRVTVETIHVNFDELALMASDYDKNVHQAAETVRTSNELDLLFSLMFDELLNGTSLVVSMSSTVNAANAPNKPPTQPPTVTATKNINQAETNKENVQVKEDEFINIFSTLVQERGETSSRHVDSSNMHTFYQRHPSEHRWTKDHSLEQVIRNTSQSIRTRCQLETDGEIYMFSLTVSRTELKNIKEAMADSAWIEAMQEELSLV